MKKHFYTHLINIESITLELDNLDLSDDERAHLAGILDSSLHNTILDAVFSQLSDEDKQVLIKYLADGNHDKTWEFLNSKVENIEEKITEAAEDLKKKMHLEISEASLLRSKT